jgi:hypothetical protein
MSLPTCPLHRMHRHDAAPVSMEDVTTLRASVRRKNGTRAPQPGFSDALLFYAANSEACLTVGLAWCLDEYDPKQFDEQETFKAAYENLRNVIRGISNNALRMSVELPGEYVASIEDNFFLDYAKRRTKGGAPEKWRLDEFYLRLFTLYRMFSGKNPAMSDDGPTMRFMRTMVAILRRRLETVEDKTTDDYVLVDELWRLPRNDVFLGEWIKRKGELADIQATVEQYAAMNITAYERSIGKINPDGSNIIYGVFGGENTL